MLSFSAHGRHGKVMHIVPCAWRSFARTISRSGWRARRNSHLTTSLHLTLPLSYPVTLAFPSHPTCSLHIPLCRAELLTVFAAGVHRELPRRYQRGKITASPPPAPPQSPPSQPPPCCCALLPDPMLHAGPRMNLAAGPHCQTLLSRRRCLLLVSIGPH